MLNYQKKGHDQNNWGQSEEETFGLDDHDLESTDKSILKFKFM